MDLGQNDTPLFDALKKHINSGIIPFHVPGHKQGSGCREFRDYFGANILKIDANGMEGLDYYNNPSGVLLEAERLLAKAYGAEQAYMLINGTTSGVLAMILSTCSSNSQIILPRNSHRSAISALILSGAAPVYILPAFHKELGIAMGVTTESINKAIKDHSQATSLFIVNPTYYGTASDLNSIVQVAHQKGLSVLVDEAHGAHFPFHTDLPMSAMKSGADMSAVSIHKTAGSLTQSSALLAGKNTDKLQIRQALNLINTSSASYILLCSLDLARKQLAVNGKDMLEEALQLARWTRGEINKIDGLYAFGKELIGTPGCFEFDETRLGIHVSDLGYTGYEVELLLRKKYNIQIELSDMYNIVAVVTIGDCEKNVRCLIDALKEISKNSTIQKKRIHLIVPEMPDVVVTPRDAYFGAKKTVRLEAAAGEVSGEMFMAYPPGIPVLGIGERITKDVIDLIKVLREEKCQLQGTADPLAETIKVLA